MNLNLNGVSANTVTITDHQVISEGLAKVIIAFTGKQSKESLQESLASKLQYLAAPVEDSFRIVRAGVAVGFIRANRAVRTIENDKELRAGYKVMSSSSNILMDNNDQTLWEVKQGAGGKYLARHGNEDLSSLIEASVNHRTDTPKCYQVSMASAAKNEFVAFASASGDMDYGFCVQANDTHVRVVSSTTNTPVILPKEVIATVLSVKIPRESHNRIVASGISPQDKKQQIEYWTRLYSYDQNYLSELKRMVNEQAVA